MIRAAAVLGFMLFCSGGGAHAQTKAEVFGGYSFERAAPCGVSGSGCNYEGNEGPLTGNYNGWEAALTVYWKKSLGVTADFAGRYGSSNLTSFSSAPGAPVSFSSYSYLFGPTYAPHLSRVTPFVHGLFGAVSWGANTAPGYTSVAWDCGGGLDVKVSRHLAVRLAQLDYVGDRARITGERTINASSWRYSLGLVVALH